jgi:WD40 repeat protein/predicted Ser/Thr protein kinase
MDQDGPEARRRWERLNDLFQHARRLPAEQRGAYLEAVCSDDAPLRNEVAGLLATDARVAEAPAAAVGGLAGLVARAGAEAAFAGRAPERIARYRILKVIGEGGMGTVYEAEEDEPPRKVALKVIRRDVLSAEAARRFELEARVLARLDHPGIAKVYAVGPGNAEGEPPWIAMELVHGRSLFDHAAEARLDAAGRVALIALAADALAHAHSRGVVHRDVKPSNLLVDDAGHPRVLDFGVARLVGPDSGLSTIHTGFGRIVGTIAYMAPEQASGAPDAADERSDIYALGVVAFELLAGRTPHELGRLPLPVALERLTRDDPPTLGTLRPDLRGDLSVVIAKATAREPGRRYDSAATLAEDLRRFLRHEPVSARAPTAGYYARKFLRRHRALVTGTLIAFFALVTGLVLALRARSEEKTERHRADAFAAASRRAAYRAELAGASAAWRGGDPQTARRRLNLVPPDQRAWEWRHLAAELERRRGPLVPAPAGTAVVGLGPETDRWLALGADGVLAELGADGRPQRRLAEGVSAFVAGAEAVLARAGDTLRLLRSGKPDLEFPADPLAPGMLAISDDGSLAVLAAHTGATGQPVAAWLTVPGSGPLVKAGEASGAVVSAAVSARGDRVVIGQSEGTVRVVDTRTGADVASVRLHMNAVHAVTFDPAGVRVASGSDDRTLYVWEPGKPPDSARRVRGFRDAVRSCAWSPDGSRVVGGDDAGCVIVADAARDEPPLVLDAEEVGAVTDIAFAADGRVVVAASARGRLELDAAPADRLRVLRSHAGIDGDNLFPYVYAVAVSPQGDRIASGGWDKTVRVHDAVTTALVVTCRCEQPVYAVAYAPGGDRLAAACIGGSLRVFDAPTGDPLLERQGLVPHQAQPLAWSPDGERLAVGGVDGRLVEISAATLADVAGPLSSRRAVAAAYSPDGRRLASIDSEGGVEVAALGLTTEPLRRQVHVGFGVSIAFSRDGSRLVTTGEDGNVVVLDAGTLRPVATFDGHRHRSYAAQFFPDGQRVASGGNDGVVRISDPANGEELVSLEGHQAYVYGIAISPDGETVVSASGDNSVRLWSAVPYVERLRRADDRLRGAGPR